MDESGKREQSEEIAVQVMTDRVPTVEGDGHEEDDRCRPESAIQPPCEVVKQKRDYQSSEKQANAGGEPTCAEHLEERCEPIEGTWPHHFDKIAKRDLSLRDSRGAGDQRSIVVTSMRNSEQGHEIKDRANGQFEIR